MRPNLVDIDPIQRIYVNRNLRLESIRAIGFDMDHTLATYKPVPFERLAFEKAKPKLVAVGYPQTLLRLKYQPDFVVRGLTVDKARGNILKMDRHRYVVQGYHGTRKLPPEQRKALYARHRIRLGGATYVPVDTLFSLPEISLYAQMVDLMDAGSEPVNYRRLYDDVRGSMDEAHADGSIKRVIARHPMRFLELDSQLPEILDRIISQGIKLFLLTNSEGPYTALIMAQLLDGRLEGRQHWTDFFDQIVVRAGKPAFFGRHDPLRPLSPRVLCRGGSRRPRFTYSGGSVHALEKVLGVQGDKILFFGDHTYGDILKSKRICGWRTAMIIRGLERELESLTETRGQRLKLVVLERQIDRLVAWRDFLDRALEGQFPEGVVKRFLRDRDFGGGRRQIPAHKEALRGQIRRLRSSLEKLTAEMEATFNPYWGPIFRAGPETSHFANQVQE
ncbi:MAG: HAD-IG family 5'-nucleotidase, partial [Candidatus Eisenbacteria sp.]|nr:HAD-IG family 5'-nucleotidase [Candidatus Eisenbacteria bacterium]